VSGVHDVRTRKMGDMIVVDAHLEVDGNTAKATGVSPQRSDGTPTTAASATAGVLAQHRFEVARVDVEAARDHHVLLAVEQDQEAIGVEAADVAGADEALALVSNHSASRVAPAGRGSRHHAAEWPTTSPGLARCDLDAVASSISRMSWPWRRQPDGVQLVGCRCASRMQVPPPSVMP
jgi:hypothetical protein